MHSFFKVCAKYLFKGFFRISVDSRKLLKRKMDMNSKTSCLFDSHVATIKPLRPLLAANTTIISTTITRNDHCDDVSSQRSLGDLNNSSLRSNNVLLDTSNSSVRNMNGFRGTDNIKISVFSETDRYNMRNMKMVTNGDNILWNAIIVLQETDNIISDVNIILWNTDNDKLVKETSLLQSENVASQASHKKKTVFI